MQKQFIITLSLSLLVLSQLMIGSNTAYASIQDDFSRELKRNPVSIRPQTITSALSFIDQKGDIYALTGLDIPEDIAPDAAKELKTLTLQQLCTQYTTKKDTLGRINRMGQLLGQFECGADRIWLQGALLAKGLARVRTTPENPELAQTMLALESTARTKKLGLWNKVGYTVLTPITAAEHMNSFQIISGTVVNVAQTREMIFLNFDRDWKTDFTIGIPAKFARNFSTKRINLQSLKGQTVRIRGWIRSYNGPFVELDHTEQLAILADPGAENNQASVSPLDTVSKIRGDAPTDMGMHSIGSHEPEKPAVEAPKSPEISKPTPPKVNLRLNP